MDLSINKIIKDNQLIKGRLRLSLTDIRKIYRTQKLQNQKIRKKIAFNEKIIESQIAKNKKLRSELKYLEETIQKAFHPSTKNISLLYKSMGKKEYIKARFYWQGMQREVQVGSIPIVLDIVSNMFTQGYLKKFKLNEGGSPMTWKRLKNNTNLIEATKEIAALKFQEYILRKISDGTGSIEKSDAQGKIKTEQKIQEDVDSLNIQHTDNEKYEWYEKWRQDNL